MKYKIDYKEVLHHTFYVDAATSEEAEAEFNRQVEANKIDFSYGEVADTNITATPVREKINFSEMKKGMILSENCWNLMWEVVDTNENGTWLRNMPHGNSNPRGMMMKAEDCTFNFYLMEENL